MIKSLIRKERYEITIVTRLGTTDTGSFYGKVWKIVLNIIIYARSHTFQVFKYACAYINKDNNIFMHYRNPMSNPLFLKSITMGGELKHREPRNCKELKKVDTTMV